MKATKAACMMPLAALTPNKKLQNSTMNRLCVKITPNKATKAKIFIINIIFVSETSRSKALNKIKTPVIEPILYKESKKWLCILEKPMLRSPYKLTH